MRRQCVGAVLMLGLVCGHTGLARAAQVTYTFEGTVTHPDAVHPLVSPLVSPGTTFTGSFGYDSAAANLGGGGQAFYSQPGGTIGVLFGGHSVSATPAGPDSGGLAVTADDTTGEAFRYAITLAPLASGLLVAEGSELFLVAIDSVSVELRAAPGAGLLNTTALGQLSLDLAQAEDATLTIEGHLLRDANDPFTLQGTLTALARLGTPPPPPPPSGPGGGPGQAAPEPAGLTLLALGGVGLVVCRLRRRVGRRSLAGDGSGH